MARLETYAVAAGLLVVLLTVAPLSSWPAFAGEGWITGFKGSKIKLYEDERGSAGRRVVAGELPGKLEILGFSGNNKRLRVLFEGREVWIDRFQVRTDAQLATPPPCPTLTAGTDKVEGHAVARGMGKGCGQ